MPWQFNQTEAVFLQIANRLKREILSGKYAPDEQLPSVRQLAAEAAVNPNTVQKSLTFLEEQGLLNPGQPTAPADVLVIPMSEDFVKAVEVATALRDAGIRTQLYTEKKKFKAKIGYADKLGIPYVIFLGEDEINEGVVACKDMTSGEQTKLPADATIDRIKAGLAEREKGTVILG